MQNVLPCPLAHYKQEGSKFKSGANAKRTSLKQVLG